MTRFHSAVFCAVAAISSAGALRAGVVDCANTTPATCLPGGASYNVYLQGFGGDYIQLSTSGTYSHAGGTVTLSSLPTVMLDSLATGTYITANANLSYNFEIFGPDSATLIPLLVQTTLSTSAGGDPNTEYAYADSQVRVTAFTQAGKEVYCGIVAGSCGAPSFSGQLTVLAYANSIYTVDIHTTAQVQVGGSAHAYADPVISIDPGFAGAGDYSVLLSDGVSNAADSSSAPEPATLSLMAVALAAAFAMRRRQIRKA